MWTDIDKIVVARIARLKTEELFSPDGAPPTSFTGIQRALFDMYEKGWNELLARLRAESKNGN